MLRSLLLSIFVWNIIALSSGCSFAYQRINQNTNEISQVNSNVTKEDDSNEYVTNKELEDSTKGEIEEISQKLGLIPLTKNTQRKVFELRLWINFGMPGDYKLLIIRSTKSGNQASFYHFRKTPPDPIKFDKEILANPNSDWNKLLSEISNRLATPNRLVHDPKLHISRHEGLISVEFVEKGEYQFALYGHHTKFGDGLRLINLCEYLSSEFGVNIDCRGQRTNLGPIVGSH
jgi:hypothetical protein